MEEEQNKINKGINKEYKILAKNSIFSIINTYSSFIFSIITSYLIARLITSNIWSYLILSTSYITIFSLILTFLPPSLDQTFNYYVPKFRALKQFNMLKSFVQQSILLRLIFVLTTFVISIGIFIFFSDLFKINLGIYYPILLLLSPLLIIDGLGKILIALERAFNLFNVALYLMIIRYVLNIGALLFLTFYINTIQLSYIALTNLFSSLVPFLINCIIIFVIIKYKLKKSEEERISFKTTFKHLYSYGSHLSVKSIIDGLIKELYVQVIRFFETPDFVTGYNIAYNYKSVSGQIIQSMPDPLTISLSELVTKQKYEETKKVVNTLYVFLVFVILFISGILIHLTDIFLFLVYGIPYLKYSLLVKLSVISILFNVINIFFQSLLRATNKVKFVIPNSLLTTAITFSLYLMGLVFFNINAAVLGIFIGSVINFFILVYFTFKLLKIKINLKKILPQYLIFFISIGISVLLDIIILGDVNAFILGVVHLSYFKNFDFLALLVFLVLYLLLNIVLKIFTVTDVEMVEAFFTKKTFTNKIILKGTKLLKKFIKKN
ncbi:MAG: hypothetical protein EAX91_03860 [Candidatus Lokiarchaeota archaeon]|nr:hypothetical protein [Candidatus Lokiarchaeota archaeon]